MSTYSIPLVILSVLTAFFAAFTALQVSTRIAHAKTSPEKMVWLTSGALAMGGGVWAMHFIGMLALSLPCGISYDPIATLLSMIPGILASGMALWIIARPKISISLLIIGGALMGSGIGLMHYSGMAAMRLDAVIYYAPSMFAASISFAVVMAILSLYGKIMLPRILPGLPPGILHTLDALLIGGAISGMHYIAMEAAYFIPVGDAPSSSPGLSPTVLAIGVATVALLLISLAFAATIMGKHLETIEVLKREMAARKELTASLEFQKHALDEHAIVSITNAKGDITYVNDKFCAISGYSREELIGQNHRILQSDEHSPAFFKTLWRTIAGGDTWQGEIKNVRKNGECYWVKATIVPFLNERGRPFQYVAIRTDITERKTIEKKFERAAHEMQTVLATTSQGFWHIDNDAVTLMVNPRMAEILGVAKWEAVGTSVYSYLSEDQQAHQRNMLKEGQQAQSRTYELILTNSAGEDVPCMFSATPMFDEAGQRSGSFALVTDITELKKYETYLETAKEEAEAASRAKSEFLSSMSHELRTPMNAIMGFAQLLEYTPDAPLNDDQKLYVHHILGSSKHLLELIDQVLELEIIEAGKLSLSVDHVSAHDVIDQAITMIQSRAERDGITIIDHTAEVELPLLWTDGARLRQALLNLLSNAVKYNVEGGTVDIHHDVIGNDMLRIRVQDTGQGIAHDRQGDLFKPFERLGRESGEIEGTGIGLSIAKQIVELLGGRIGFHSEEHKGSAFWIDVPVSSLRIDAPRSSDTTPVMIVGTHLDGVSHGAHSVLYIEDNPANMTLMETMLGQFANLKLRTAYTVELGLDLAKHERPDLILMDVNLPGIDGIETLQHLQDDPQTQHIPVIAITAAAMPKDIEAGLAAGFRDYIIKPIDVANFLKTVETVLEVPR